MKAKKFMKLLFCLLTTFFVAGFQHTAHAESDAVLDYDIDRTFNGTSDFIDKTADLKKVKDLSEGSVLVKFKTTTPTVANTFLSASATKDASSNISFTMNNGSIYVENRQNGSYATRLTANGSYNDGKWHTAVWTVGESGTKIYVDGNEMGSTSSKAFFPNVKNLDGMWLGKNVDNDGDEWFYKGDIEKVQVYDKALSAEEVKALSPSKNDHTNGFFHEKELFNINDGKGYAQYRIPSVTVTADGTILAVAEARTGGDQTPTDLVLRRSTDGGETFSDQTILAPGVANGDAEMNPMLLAEDNGNTVHLLWSRWEWGNSKFFIRTSTDNGATWDKAKDITNVLDAYTDPNSGEYFKDLSAAGMGPGHGFQMADGTLVVPIYMTTYGWSVSTVAYIYSEDGGKTWEAGPKVPNPSGYTQIHENMMVETSDGGLMANMRNPGSNYRAVSRTGGINQPWTTPVSDQKLIDPVNEASLAKYDENTILFTNTANTSTRTNMTVRMSDDDGQTWFASKEIFAGNTGYSDIFVSPDKTINTLYEKPAGSKIVLAQFNKDWIVGNANIRVQADKQTEPEEPTTVKTTFTNHSDEVEKNVNVKLDLPKGWTVKENQPSSFSEVKPGDSVEVSWDVTPGKDVEPGSHDLTAVASFTLDGEKLRTTATEKIQVLPSVPTETSYLSDLYWINSTNGWGPVEKDMSNGESGAGDGKAITINDKTYEKGLGVHAHSEIVYNLGGNFSRFQSDVGVDDEVSASSAASVVFQVWGDGEKLYDSGLMTGKDDAKSVDISIKDVKELKLIVTDGGNGNGSDHADWANAKVIVNKADLSASKMKDKVNSYEKEGEFAADSAARALKVHLTAVAHYENKEMTSKVVKHLNGFEQLLENQKKKAVISDKAYESLKEDTGYLIEQYQ